MRRKARSRRSRRGWARFSGLVAAFVAVAVASGAGLLAREKAGAAPAPPPTVKAQAAAVIDRTTGKVMYAFNSREELPPSSLTKVMTALVVLEHVQNLDSYAVVPSEAVGQRGVYFGLQVGDRITIRNLLRCSLIRGASDCSITLAHYVAGSQEAFVNLMNANANQLGMTSTHFVNATGVTDPDQYSSALDLARLGRAAMHNRRFRPFVNTWQVHVRWPPDHDAVVRSRNWLVRNHPWADGIKTGNTRPAGLCMMASGVYESHPLIVVTLHEPNVPSEKKDVLELFQYASERDH
jgi:D-alanyl-D-alanine carboxypeptidase (penicillin-binding protein 5/6)